MKLLRFTLSRTGGCVSIVGVKDPASGWSLVALAHQITDTVVDFATLIFGRRARRISGTGLFLIYGLAACGADSNLVSWSEPVSIARGAWGRMARLSNGSWLLVHTMFPKGALSYLRVLHSTDAARTWTRLAEVVEAGRKLDNGNLLALPNGEVLLTGRSLIDGESYQLPVFRSANGGNDWTRLSNIDANEGSPGTLKGRGLWEPHLALLRDGRVTVMYSSEKHAGYSQIVAQKVSPDRGVSWGPEIRAVAEPGGGKLRPGMPVLAHLTNGESLLVYEVVGLGRGDVYCKLSRDGITWTDGLGQRIPAQEAGPFVLATDEGRVFVTSCANVLSVSDDAGHSWRRSDPPPFPIGFKYSWPALYQTGPEEIAAMISGAGIKLRFGRSPSAAKERAVQSK